MAAPWKVMAAAFAALLAAALFLVALPGLGNINISSPFGSIFPQAKPSAVAGIVLSPVASLELSPNAPVNFTGRDFSLENFRGKILLDFQNGSICFRETGSQLALRSGLSGVLSGLSMDKMELNDVGFSVVSGKLNLSSAAGQIFFYNFIGSAGIANSSISFDGNYSSVKGDTWEIK